MPNVREDTEKTNDTTLPVKEDWNPSSKKAYFFLGYGSEPILDEINTLHV